MRRRSFALSLFVIGTSVLLPLEAMAWPGTEVFPGVTYEHRSGLQDYGSGAYAQEIYITYVDTSHPSVSFIATKPGQRGTVVSQFAATAGAAVAINTNFYASGAVPCGMAMGDGELFTDAYQGAEQGSCAHSIAVGPGNSVSFPDTWGIPNGPAPAGAHEVCTGMPTLVRAGVVVPQSEIEGSAYPDHMATAQPRTAMCLHDDQHTLILAVVDGREAGVRVGMRGITLANFMKSLGCHQAVNLDGGGSSTMFIEGQTPYPGRPEGVVNRTSDGQERAVCCHFGVRIDPNPPVPDAGPEPGAEAGPDAGPDATADVAADVSMDVLGDSPVPLDSNVESEAAGGAGGSTGGDASSPDGSGTGNPSWSGTEEASGCACSAPHSAPGPSVWVGLWLMAIAGWRIRRRRGGAR